jgi:HTH-type transcriptional regulator/antitoxin HigA
MKSVSCDIDPMPKTFEELHSLHPLRPIGDKVDFENAQQIADRLAVLDRRTRDQEDYLETLATLMEKYESEHSPIHTRNLDPIATLRFLMDQHGLSASDIGRVLGQRQLGAAILRRDRALSKGHVLKLARHFGVGVGAFLKEGKTRRPSLTARARRR